MRVGLIDTSMGIDSQLNISRKIDFHLLGHCVGRKICFIPSFPVFVYIQALAFRLYISLFTERHNAQQFVFILACSLSPLIFESVLIT